MTSVGAALLESDCRYFELGADVVELDGAAIASVAGLEHIPGACVVQRVEARRITLGYQAWVRATTDCLRRIGCLTARIYLVGPEAGLEDALATVGFEKRLEVGYVSAGVLATGRTDVVLRPVDGELGWEVKRKLHAGSDTAADGHRARSEDWVELERRKCATRDMRAFLVEVGGDVCGAVATLDLPRVMRAKNLFVHPDRRREGIAAGVVRALSRRAAELGAEAVGLFGVPGNPADAVYRRLGMEPVVSQFEWSMSLRP